MQDMQISGSAAMAWGLWTAALVLVITDLFLTTDDVGHLGMVLGAAAGTLHIRGMLCTHAQSVREAFDLGRDAGRLEVVPSQRHR